MTTASTEYLGDLRTTCTHNSSGTTIYTDAPVDNKGKGSTFSPTDLFVTSYAACMTTIIGIYCQENQITINHCNAKVNKIMYSNPRRIGEIHIEMDLRGNQWDELTLKKVIRAGETCPVAMSINPEIKTNITYLTDSE
jgi:putative redox protein